MLKGRDALGNPAVRLNRENAPKIMGFGALTGLFSGFFGIGGGFLIVPGLIASTGMPMINAVGSSLVAVSAFGLTDLAELCQFGAYRLAVGGGVHRWRGRRRPARCPHRQAPVEQKGIAQQRICQPDLCRCRLYAVAKQCGAAGVRAVAAVQTATVAGSYSKIPRSSSLRLRRGPLLCSRSAPAADSSWMKCTRCNRASGIAGQRFGGAIGSRKAAAEHNAILDRHGSTLAHERQHRVGGVAKQRDAAIGEPFHRRAGRTAPSYRPCHREPRR